MILVLCFYRDTETQLYFNQSATPVTSIAFALEYSSRIKQCTGRARHEAWPTLLVKQFGVVNARLRKKAKLEVKICVKLFPVLEIKKLTRKKKKNKL